MVQQEAERTQANDEQEYLLPQHLSLLQWGCGKTRGVHLGSGDGYHFCPVRFGNGVFFLGGGVIMMGRKKMTWIREPERFLFLCNNGAIPAAVTVTYTGHELSYSSGMSPEQMAPHTLGPVSNHTHTHALTQAGNPTERLSARAREAIATPDLSLSKRHRAGKGALPRQRVTGMAVSPLSVSFSTPAPI